MEDFKVEGRNAVIELLKSGREINKIFVSVNVSFNFKNTVRLLSIEYIQPHISWF